jgi:hypothetical protein
VPYLGLSNRFRFLKDGCQAADKIIKLYSYQGMFAFGRPAAVAPDFADFRKEDSREVRRTAMNRGLGAARNDTGCKAGE